MSDIQSGERTAEDDSLTLGKLIYRTRQQTVTLQRMLTKRSGVCQSSISAYEQGRVEPTWSTFVRLIAAMDRRPSIDVVPVDPPPAPDHAAFLLGCLDVAIRECSSTPTRWWSRSRLSMSSARACRCCTPTNWSTSLHGLISTTPGSDNPRL